MSCYSQFKSNLSSLNLVSTFRCPNPPCNPMYVSRVDPWLFLDFSLSYYRHPCTCVSFSSRFINNKHKTVTRGFPQTWGSRSNYNHTDSRGHYETWKTLFYTCVRDPTWIHWVVLSTTSTFLCWVQSYDGHSTKLKSRTGELYSMIWVKLEFFCCPSPSVFFGCKPVWSFRKSLKGCLQRGWTGRSIFLHPIDRPHEWGRSKYSAQMHCTWVSHLTQVGWRWSSPSINRVSGDGCIDRHLLYQ